MKYTQKTRSGGGDSGEQKTELMGGHGKKSPGSGGGKLGNPKSRQKVKRGRGENVQKITKMSIRTQGNRGGGGGTKRGVTVKKMAT